MGGKLAQLGRLLPLSMSVMSCRIDPASLLGATESPLYPRQMWRCYKGFIDSQSEGDSLWFRIAQIRPAASHCDTCETVASINLKCGTGSPKRVHGKTANLRVVIGMFPTTGFADRAPSYSPCNLTLTAVLYPSHLSAKQPRLLPRRPKTHPLPAINFADAGFARCHAELELDKLFWMLTEPFQFPSPTNSSWLEDSSS
jgi:hypothetical protein